MSEAWINDFCAWARTRNIGCMFARVMFRLPKEYGLSFTIMPDVSGTALATSIIAETSRHIAAMESEALVVVFDPALPSAEFEVMIDALAQQSGWCLRADQKSYEGKQFRLVGLDVVVGRDQGTQVLSELVGFGPYTHLPKTRQSPIPAIALRTKPGLSGPPLEGRTERRANLASIKFDVPSQTFDKLWALSQALRNEIDGLSNPLARARVTMCFPA